MTHDNSINNYNIKPEINIFVKVLIRNYFLGRMIKNKKRSQVAICSNSLNPLNQLTSLVGTYRILDKQSRQKKIIKDKQTKYAMKLLAILLPMLIVPMVSYDFLIFYFKHNTVIYSSIIFGLMIGIILLYIGEKAPKIILRK